MLRHYQVQYAEFREANCSPLNIPSGDSSVLGHSSSEASRVVGARLTAPAIHRCHLAPGCGLGPGDQSWARSTGPLPRRTRWCVNRSLTLHSAPSALRQPFREVCGRWRRLPPPPTHLTSCARRCAAPGVLKRYLTLYPLNVVS